ncbi:MAG: poly(R)-hydroxyalkanoic acid synthase subunit PhaE [Clostridia bacterium]|jgi:class III poly(R)-hydroxyalkanoic acid synthase PhaE subunit|nr:poly(R)-hydroxyalkanoic acid synthase subunit PhaE [Clostridia bacterium]
MNKNQDMFKMFLEAQQETAKLWQDIFEKTLQSGEAQAMMNFFNPEEYMKAAYDIGKKHYRAYTGEPGQLYGKLLEGQQAYHNAYKTWLKLNEESFKPSAEAARKMYEEWVANFSEQMKSSYLSYLPEPMKKIIEESVSLMEAYRKAAEKLWQPWLESQENLTENFAAGITYDPKAYLEFLQIWKENYEQSISKLVNIPMMGYNREFLEKQSDNFDKFIRFSTLVNEVMANIYKIGQETMKKVIEDYAELYKEGQEIKTFDDFYRFWAKEIGDALDALYFSSDFSELIGHTLQAMTELKKESDKLWEDYLKYLPIPKNSDMNSLYKTMNELKKEIKTLKKEIGQLKKIVAAQPEPVAKEG